MVQNHRPQTQARRIHVLIQVRKNIEHELKVNYEKYIQL